MSDETRAADNFRRRGLTDFWVAFAGSIALIFMFVTYGDSLFDLLANLGISEPFVRAYFMGGLLIFTGAMVHGVLLLLRASRLER